MISQIAKWKIKVSDSDVYGAYIAFVSCDGGEEEDIMDEKYAPLYGIPAVKAHHLYVIEDGQNVRDSDRVEDWDFHL